jgi:hypothetical protein
MLTPRALDVASRRAPNAPLRPVVGEDCAAAALGMPAAELGGGPAFAAEPRAPLDADRAPRPVEIPGPARESAPLGETDGAALPRPPTILAPAGIGTRWGALGTAGVGIAGTLTDGVGGAGALTGAGGRIGTLRGGGAGVLPGGGGVLTGGGGRIGTLTGRGAGTTGTFTGGGAGIKDAVTS